MENKLYSLTSLEKISGGNNDFIKKMITLFMEITPKNVQELKLAVQNKKYEEAGKIAHSMKPSLDQMGITSLHQTIRDLEKLKTEELDHRNIQPLISKLDETLKQVYNQLGDF